MGRSSPRWAFWGGSGSPLLSASLATPSLVVSTCPTANGQLRELVPLSFTQLGKSPLRQLVDAALHALLCSTIRDPLKAADELHLEFRPVGDCRLSSRELLDSWEPIVRAKAFHESGHFQIGVCMEQLNQMSKQLRVRQLLAAHLVDVSGGDGRERRIVEEHTYRTRRGRFRALQALGVRVHPPSESIQPLRRIVSCQLVEPPFHLAPIPRSRDACGIRLANLHH